MLFPPLIILLRIMWLLREYGELVTNIAHRVLHLPSGENLSVESGSLFGTVYIWAWRVITNSRSVVILIIRRLKTVKMQKRYIRHTLPVMEIRIIQDGGSVTFSAFISKASLIETIFTERN